MKDKEYKETKTGHKMVRTIGSKNKRWRLKCVMKDCHKEALVFKFMYLFLFIYIYREKFINYIEFIIIQLPTDKCAKCGEGSRGRKCVMKDCHKFALVFKFMYLFLFIYI